MATQSVQGNTVAWGGLVISSLLGGFIAGFVWMAIATLVGGLGAGTIVGWGIGFLIIGAIATAIIGSIVHRARVSGR